jgi:hypothetical protein
MVNKLLMSFSHLRRQLHKVHRSRVSRRGLPARAGGRHGSDLSAEDGSGPHRLALILSAPGLDI